MIEIFDPKVTTAIVQAYIVAYGHAPSHVARAPGRVNLIGDHTDYCQGFALPMAIHQHTAIAAGPGEEPGVVRIRSLSSGQEQRIHLDRDRRPQGNWGDYLRGVLAGYGLLSIHPPALDVLVGGDLPQGAGLSSSAALELAFAMLIEGISGQSLEPEHRIRLCQIAENDFAGMPCGILDQFAVGMATPGHAMLLDCRDVTARQIPLPEDPQFVVIDSGVAHQLTDGGYAQRFREAREAEQQLGRSLRDCELADVASLEDATLRARAQHIVSENQRVLDFARALELQDWSQAGALMSASHASLRDDYAVSCPEVDALVNAACAAGALGARMTGGGFGGAVIALVPDADREAFLAHLSNWAAASDAQIGKPTWVQSAGSAEVQAWPNQ